MSSPSRDALPTGTELDCYRITKLIGSGGVQSDLPGRGRGQPRQGRNQGILPEALRSTGRKGPHPGQQPRETIQLRAWAPPVLPGGQHPRPAGPSQYRAGAQLLPVPRLRLPGNGLRAGQEPGMLHQETQGQSQHQLPADRFSALAGGTGHHPRHQQPASRHQAIEYPPAAGREPAPAGLRCRVPPGRRRRQEGPGHHPRILPARAIPVFAPGRPLDRCVCDRRQHARLHRGQATALVHRAGCRRQPATGRRTVRKALPKHLLAAVDWAMRLKPEGRPQSAGVLRQALLGELPVPTLP